MLGEDGRCRVLGVGVVGDGFVLKEARRLVRLKSRRTVDGGFWLGCGLDCDLGCEEGGWGVVDAGESWGSKGSILICHGFVLRLDSDTADIVVVVVVMIFQNLATGVGG